MRCRKRDLVERRVLRLELLNHRDALNEPRHDLLDLWIQFSIVGLRILLRLPQADCFQLPLFRCYEQQLVQESLLPAKQGEDFLFKRYRKFVDHLGLQLQHDFTCEHISLPLILFGGAMPLIPSVFFTERQDREFIPSPKALSHSNQPISVPRVTRQRIQHHTRR